MFKVLHRYSDHDLSFVSALINRVAASINQCIYTGARYTPCLFKTRCKQRSTPCKPKRVQLRQNFYSGAINMVQTPIQANQRNEHVSSRGTYEANVEMARSLPESPRNCEDICFRSERGSFFPLLFPSLLPLLLFAKLFFNPLRLDKKIMENILVSPKRVWNSNKLSLI